MKVHYLLIVGLLTVLSGCKTVQEKGLLGAVFSGTSSGKKVLTWELQPLNKEESCLQTMYKFEDERHTTKPRLISWDGSCSDGFAQGLGKAVFDHGAFDSFKIGFYEDGRSLGHSIIGTQGAQEVSIVVYESNGKRAGSCQGKILNGELVGPKALNPYNPRRLCQMMDLAYDSTWVGISDEFNVVIAKATLAKYLSGQGNDYPSYGPKMTATGTGFIVSQSGHILTNQHVIDGARNISVLFNGERVKAELLDRDKTNDIALLRIERNTKQIPIEVKSKKGGRVAVLGYPNIGVQGNEQKVTFGEINANSGIQGDPRYIQISSPIQPGNSGSPALDSKGSVIGIVTSTLDQRAAIQTSGTLAQNVNYAIRIAYALPMLLKNNVEYADDAGPKELSNTALVDRTSESVVLVIAE